MGEPKVKVGYGGQAGYGLVATGGGRVAADVGEPSGAGTDVVGPKGTDAALLRMLRRAAG